MESTCEESSGWIIAVLASMRLLALLTSSENYLQYHRLLAAALYRRSTAFTPGSKTASVKWLCFTSTILFTVQTEIIAAQKQPNTWTSSLKPAQPSWQRQHARIKDEPDYMNENTPNFMPWNINYPDEIVLQ
jgi:hypothetical protein